MVKTTPKEFSEKWGRRLKGSTTDIRRGVEKVEDAPSKAAVEKKHLFKERLVAAIDAGRWERPLLEYSLEEWKSDMNTKGIPRISGGVDAAGNKMIAFGEALLPHIASGQSAVEKLPELTLEDKISRMNTFVRHMAKLRYK